MKKYIVILVVLLVAGGYVYLSEKRIKSLASERDKYLHNTETLWSDVETFKVRDSLSAARVLALELSVKEFERFRAQDAALIKDLKAKNRDLAAVNKTQSQTIINLQAVPRDTIVIRDSVKIPAVAVHAGDAWFDFDGLLTEKDFTGTLKNRDSLLVAESVKYKRFLGFLWRTNKVKDREVSVLSHNPHTEILGVEYVVVEK
jgi:hypothetical protein